MNRRRTSQKLIAAAAGARQAGGLTGAGYRAGLGLALVAAAVLAAVGAPGLSQPVAQASSSPALTWTKQAPAVHPRARDLASMAYDAATGTVVLFGGMNSNGRSLNDTWAWDGSTWTQQHPMTSPTLQWGASMAYDAATGTVVLFGGVGHRHLRNGTWVWDGITWTKQHPATSPPARAGASMAYDAATGNVVLFGGEDNGLHPLADTWVWDGTTWTKQAPATSPPARDGASMTYDAATGNVVLFGGFGAGHGPRVYRSDTWIWDGTTWTKQSPATHPRGRIAASMAYDAATGTVVLFGGRDHASMFGDTWIWDGTTWTKQAPATHPLAEIDASMAYDAATGTVVLFSGLSVRGHTYPGTWVWGSS